MAVSLKGNYSFIGKQKTLYFILFYHLQKHIPELDQMEVDKEPLLHEQAGRDNFCPDVVINSNCCKPPQPLQLPIGIRQRYA